MTVGTGGDVRAIRTFDSSSRLDGPAIDAFLEAKRDRTISVCVPCRNEERTIGHLVESIHDELLTPGVVDELVVLDDRSTDATGRVAREAGARVVAIDDVHRVHGEGHGKGNALWATLVVSRGDIVVWCDGDVTSFEPAWITTLAAPLLDDPSVALVKAMYDRPSENGGGGRTTELVARPLMSRYFPELTGLAQPLSGEYAGRRCVLEDIDFVRGWGVEAAMLIDVARRHGADSIGQVDLGSRLHRHRDLHDLSVQAAEVMATILDRAADPPGPPPVERTLRRSDGSVVRLEFDERPSLASLGLGRTSAPACP